MITNEELNRICEMVIGSDMSEHKHVGNHMYAATCEPHLHVPFRWDNADRDVYKPWRDQLDEMTAEFYRQEGGSL